MRRHVLNFEPLPDANAERIDPLAIVALWTVSAAAIIVLFAVFASAVSGN